MTANKHTPVDSASIPQADWKWYGMAAHFICAADCLFHMATEVGDYIVSSVGDLRLRQPGGERGERQEIGCGRTYETFVFEAMEKCECGCGMPTVNGTEIDCEIANDPETARINHMAMCEKYAAIAKATGGAA